MLADVLLLRRNGLRLRRSELAPAVRGTVHVYGRASSHTSFKRETMSASLMGTRGANSIQVELIAPLFDVRLLGIEGSTLTMIGLELSSSGTLADGNFRLVESAQIWRCMLVTDPPAPLAAGLRHAVADAAANG